MNLVLRLVLSLLVPLVLASSCTKKPETGGSGSAVELPPGEDVVTFGRGTLRIKDETLSIEIANSPAQRGRGLMYRKQLLPGHGMLFIFPVPEYLNFYMKNTFFPLSIAFIDKDKKIVDIQNMAAAKENQESFPIYVSKEEAMYALEVPLGWFRDRQIRVGDSVAWSE